jgi:hypothetical protein
MLHLSKKILWLSSLLALTACSADPDSAAEEEIGQTSEIAEEQEEVTAAEKTEAEPEVVAEEPEAIEEEPDEVAADEVNEAFQWIYDELSGKSFIFSSGAGAWRTAFTFTDNGTFSGTYSDANGPEIFVSEFVGQFAINEEVDEFTYRLDLTNFDVTSETGTEEQDGDMIITYVDEPHGFPTGSDTFELYLPYKPKSEVSDEYLSWVYGQANNGREFLNSFGLYNVNKGFGMEELLD